MLERSLFVEILLIQPFAFYEAQFFASAGMLVALPLLGIVQYVLRRQTEAEDDSRDDEVSPAERNGLHPATLSPSEPVIAAEGNQRVE